MSEIRLRRVWLFPFIIEVQQHIDRPDWRGRTYWWRRCAFLRRKTAEAYASWLANQEGER